MRITWTRKMKWDVLFDLGLVVMMLGFLVFEGLAGMNLALRAAYMFTLLGGIALLHLPMKPGVLDRIRSRVLYGHTMLLAALLMPVGWTMSWDLVYDPGKGQIGWAVIFVCVVLIMIIDGGKRDDEHGLNAKEI